MMRGVIGVYFGVVVTPWKLIGFVGALMFAGRWIVQALATRRAGRPDDSAQLLDHQPHRQRDGHVVFHLGQERRGRRVDQSPARVGGVLQPRHGHQGEPIESAMPDIGLFGGPPRPRIVPPRRRRQNRSRGAHGSAEFALLREPAAASAIVIPDDDAGR